MKNHERVALGIAAAAAGAGLLAARLARDRFAISFENRVVVITGGSRGLGFVMARQLADEGARLVILARDTEELERARQQLEVRGAEVLALRCDIRRRADVRAAVDTIIDRFRAVDVLINNAGIIQVGPLDDMTPEDFENAMATHFWGPLHLTLEIVPIMRHRGFGRIVNIASIGGKVAVPHLAPYAASKFALVGLSDAVRTELDQHGIRVTTVAPGLMRTGSAINALFKGQHEAEYAWFKAASSVPVLTIDAERAAHKILEACRYGDPELTITPQAKLLAKANAVFPGLVAGALTLASKLLPGANGADGRVARRGRELDEHAVPSMFTKLTDRAAVANNEV
jgi:NAD(P)-dependent dehydrogenase (short-subunit alcohol dehydrogenase family)